MPLALPALRTVCLPLAGRLEELWEASLELLDDEFEDDRAFPLGTSVFAGDPPAIVFTPCGFDLLLRLGEPLPWRLFRIFLNTPYLLRVCLQSK